MARDDYFGDEDKGGFFKRHSVALVVGAIVLGVGGTIAYKMVSSGHSGGSQMRQQEVVMLKLPPPPVPTPPPPPPPPPPPRPDEQKMEEQQPVQNEEKPPDKPPDAAPPVSTGIVGNGPGDSFGLGSSGDGSGFGASGRGGSKWGWYATEVQTRIKDALQQNPHTRFSSMRIEVRIWPDNTGRVTRAQLVESTGDQSLDNTIKNEILTGLQLQEPPPPGMPTPIVLRLTAQKSRTN